MPSRQPSQSYRTLLFLTVLVVEEEDGKCKNEDGDEDQGDGNDELEDDGGGAWVAQKNELKVAVSALMDQVPCRERMGWDHRL